jgi:hypothetical protein
MAGVGNLGLLLSSSVLARFLLLLPSRELGLAHSRDDCDSKLDENFVIVSFNYSCTITVDAIPTFTVVSTL